MDEPGPRRIHLGLRSHASEREQVSSAGAADVSCSSSSFS